MRVILANPKTPPNAVDREAGTITGCSLVEIGPARGHNCDVDAMTLSQCNAILNGRRLRAYLTHDGALTADRVGKELGYFTNARIDGTKLRADFHALKSWRTHNSAAFDHLFELAEQAPELMGLSLVLDANVTGGLVRVTEVYSCDFVDNPAATSGLFHATAEPGKPTVKLSEQYLQIYRRGGPSAAREFLIKLEKNK